MNYNQQYYNALEKILLEGRIVNPRVLECKEVICFQFKIDPNDNIITLPGFETNVKYAKEELKWYLSGSNRIDFSDIIKKTWKKYSDDGIHVNSAYGHRIFGRHTLFLNQWEWVKEELKADKHSRRCVININSVIDKKETNDSPCTMFYQVLIRDNKLIWITTMRSQDIYYGTRNDIYCFTEMQKKLAKELKLEVGDYYHLCNSLHLYEKHYIKAENLLKTDITTI